MEVAEHEGRKILGPDRQHDTEKHGKEKKGDFAKSKFRYDADNDCYICPRNRRLEFQRMVETKNSPLIFEYYDRCACAVCQFASVCLSKNSTYRVIQRDYREPLRENLRKELDSNKGFLMYGKRSQTVETSFGNVKQNRGVRQLYYRGNEKSDAEWKTICMGINILKIVKFLQEKDWKMLLDTALNPI